LCAHLVDNLDNFEMSTGEASLSGHMGMPIHKICRSKQYSTCGIPLPNCLAYAPERPIGNRSKHAKSRVEYNINFLTLWSSKLHPPATSQKSLLDLIAIQ